MAYLEQSNEYGCGVFAVMNAINHIMPKDSQLGFKDVPRYEKLLETDKEMGTQEAPMLRELRKYFYARFVKKFNKRKLDKWLAKGNHVIISYCYNNKLYEWHYTNIFRLNNGRYEGVNFWTRGFHHAVNEIFTYWYCSRPGWPKAHIIYLRKRGK